MRQITLIVALALSGLLAPRLSLADCHTPAAPDKFPEAQTATEENIVAAQQMVKAYLSEMETALKCMDSSHQDHAHDVAIDDMKKVAAKFNTLLRAYKARQAG